MKFPLKLLAGKKEMPVALLIHGLGMNNYFWVDPEKCHVLGGLAPLSIFLANAVDKTKSTISFGSIEPHTRGLWNYLKKEGFFLLPGPRANHWGRFRLQLMNCKPFLKQSGINGPAKKSTSLVTAAADLLPDDFWWRETVPI